MASEILQKERDTAKGAVGELGGSRLCASAIEEVRYDGIDLGIHTFDPFDRGFDELARGTFSPRDEGRLGGGIHSGEVGCAHRVARSFRGAIRTRGRDRMISLARFR
jgi:hypothetical protein